MSHMPPHPRGVGGVNEAQSASFTPPNLDKPEPKKGKQSDIEGKHAAQGLCYTLLKTVPFIEKRVPGMKIVLNDPVIVSQAPPELRGWGPWQFPLLLPLADGRLLLEYHRELDSAQAYGLPVGQSISSDGGVSWEEVPAPGIWAGLRLLKLQGGIPGYGRLLRDHLE